MSLHRHQEFDYEDDDDYYYDQPYEKPPVRWIDVVALVSVLTILAYVVYNCAVKMDWIG